MIDWRKIRLNRACKIVMEVLEDCNAHPKKELLNKVRIYNPRASAQHITTYISTLRIALEPRGYSILFTREEYNGAYRLVRLCSPASANDQE